MQSDVNKISYKYRILPKGIEKDGTRSKRVLTAFLLQVREIFYTTSTTFAFLWKQGKRGMLRVPLFDKRN